MGTTSTCIALILLFASGQCQFSGMSGMFGGMNPMSMGSGMFGGMNPMMSAMGGMGGIAGMGGFGSGMMGSMIMGNLMNDPLMTLAMGTIELSGTELMILNNLVKTIVGPEANVNPALLILYSSDGGLPINAAKMIPYITIMQGMAKDLKVRVPGVVGAATDEQIENYIFQRSLQWMQSRNMAGAFVENAGLFLMSNTFNNAGPSTPFSSPSAPASDVSSAAATARASASARAALAKFLAGQTKNSTAAVAKPAAAGAATPSAKPPTLPQLDGTQSNLLAKLMSSSMGQSGSSSLSLPTLPSGMNFPSSMTGSSSSGSSSMNPAMMAMGGMEMFGF